MKRCMFMFPGQGSQFVGMSGEICRSGAATDRHSKPLLLVSVYYFTSSKSEASIRRRKSNSRI
jgi:hypothetical protein